MVEMRGNVNMLHMYAAENQDYWPASFLRAGIPGSWAGPGGVMVSDDEYLGAQIGYWPYAMRESYANNSMHPSLMCPANGDTEDHIEEMAEKLGADSSQLVFAQDRILSAAFFVRPTWCMDDQPFWKPSAATVGKIAQVAFPSSKAAVYDSKPFHDKRWTTANLPSPSPPYEISVASVDSSVSFRWTNEVNQPILIGQPFNGGLSELRRATSVFQLTRGGWLGRDW